MRKNFANARDSNVADGASLVVSSVTSGTLSVGTLRSAVAPYPEFKFQYAVSALHCSRHVGRGREPRLQYIPLPALHTLISARHLPF